MIDVAKTIELKLADKSMYNSTHCMFALENGDILKLCYADCVEIFATVSDALDVPGWEKMAEQMDDAVEERNRVTYERAV